MLHACDLKTGTGFQISLLFDFSFKFTTISISLFIFSNSVSRFMEPWDACDNLCFLLPMMIDQ